MLLVCVCVGLGERISADCLALSLCVVVFVCVVPLFCFASAFYFISLQ